MTKIEVIAKIREEYGSGYRAISTELMGEVILTMASGDKFSAMEILDELVLADLDHVGNALRVLLAWAQDNERTRS